MRRKGLEARGGGEFAFETPAEALACLWDRLAPLDTEEVSLPRAWGRILAESIVADRPSPACNVSAMDGYALRVGDASGTVPVFCEVEAGRQAPTLPAGCAARIFTGGVLPEQGEAVLPRERVIEAPDHIVVPEGLRVSAGQHIRYRGENANRGDVVVRAGTVMHPGRAAAAASFGVRRVRVYRRVRVGLLVTGNEVVSDGEAAPTEVVDANGPSVASLLAALPYADVVDVSHVRDDPGQTREALGSLLAQCDAVWVTGGVSLGDYDYVPTAVSAIAKVVFRGLPIRPGKPILAAIHSDNKLILGLPGNPVSVMVGARRFGLEAVRRLAGVSGRSAVSAVQLDRHDGKTIGLWWYRPVMRTRDGAAALSPSRGSGDVVAAAASDGFVELPPNAAGLGPWPFYPWGVEG
jgi:molybdopterin molybdotransferase